MKYTVNKLLCCFLIPVLVVIQGCEEFVEVSPPRTDLVRKTVFTNDKTATAAMANVYADMAFSGFVSGSSSSYSLLGAFSADDWTAAGNPAQEIEQFSNNDLNPRNSRVTGLWTDLYRYVYKANAVLEGLQSGFGLSAGVKAQLEGEALFVRGFSYFYLTNLWGDVPIVISTDYRINSQLQRSPQHEVYAFIISDLMKATELLEPEYSYSGGEKIRPNKWVAEALIARVHLFHGNWSKAEEAASQVISQTELYGLSSDLNDVFTKNSSESLWQLHSREIPLDLGTFTIFSGPSHGMMRNELVTAFHPDDRRLQEWIGVVDGPTQYYYSKKYQNFLDVTEYSTVMRLSELYLIRAESRSMQERLNGENSAIEDVNVIRARAGLAPFESLSKEDLLDEIFLQRRLEFFCEWGHRWLDLKRSGRIDGVMTDLKPGTWQTTDALFPIPEEQILRSTIVINQNPGY